MIGRKICIICLLAVAAGSLYAGDAPLNVATALSMRATATLGYNLETGASGMSTVINWLELSFTPTSYRTTESPPPMDEEAPHSFFSISGLDMTILSSTKSYGWTDSATGFAGMSFSGVTAKLIVPPLWFGIIYQGDEGAQIWNYDQFISDRAMIGTRTCYRALQDGGIVANHGNYDIANASWQLRNRDLFQAAYDTSGHLLIGYDQELFSVIGKIGSRYDWTVAVPEDETANHEYAFGADVTLRLIPKLLMTLDGYGTTYIDSSGDPMFSFKAMYDLTLYETLIWQPFVGFDGQPTTDGMNMEVSGGINIPWPGGNYQVDPIYILSNGSPDVTNTNSPSRFQKNATIGGLTLGTTFFFPDDGSTPIGMVDFSLFEAQGDEGLYRELGMVLTAQLYDILGNIEFGVAGYIDFQLFEDSFLPFIAFQYQDYDQENYAAAVDNLDLHLGIHYIKIENAIIGLEYETGNLLLEDEPEWGNIYAILALTY